MSSGSVLALVAAGADVGADSVAVAVSSSESSNLMSVGLTLGFLAGPAQKKKMNKGEQEEEGK